MLTISACKAQSHNGMLGALRLRAESAARHTGQEAAFSCSLPLPLLYVSAGSQRHHAALFLVQTSPLLQHVWPHGASQDAGGSQVGPQLPPPHCPQVSIILEQTAINNIHRVTPCMPAHTV
jgi:hypothetical protein